jgi:DNA-binding TFAR19-related protein (PDSD5 family)
LTQDIEQLEAEIERVREREEKKLIRIAKASGYFGQKITADELKKVLKSLAAENKKESQLKRLEDRMKVTKQVQSQQERKDDARRKILLGAFLIAQIEHRPEEFGWVAGELRKFLDTHPDQSVAQRNKQLMSEFI